MQFFILTIFLLNRAKRSRFCCFIPEAFQIDENYVERTDVAALVRSHLNGLKPFERTIERTTETMSPSPKTITAAAMTTNRITSLRELLHY